MALRQSALEVAAREAAAPLSQSGRQQWRRSWGTWRRRGAPSVRHRHLGRGEDGQTGQVTNSTPRQLQKTLRNSRGYHGLNVLNSLFLCKRQMENWKSFLFLFIISFSAFSLSSFSSLSLFSSSCLFSVSQHRKNIV